MIESNFPKKRYENPKLDFEASTLQDFFNSLIKNNYYIEYEFEEKAKRDIVKIQTPDSNAYIRFYINEFDILNIYLVETIARDEGYAIHLYKIIRKIAELSNISIIEGQIISKYALRARLRVFSDGYCNDLNEIPVNLDTDIDNLGISDSYNPILRSERTM